MERTPKKWKKILYLNQGVPDNYVDKSFLDELEKNVFHTFSSGLILCTILLGLSPILKTLTSDISEDTIWSMTFGMFLANMAFHNYSSEQKNYIEFPNSLSVNASVFASVLLASRLNSDFSVFTLIFLAMIIFGLFPILRRDIKKNSATLDGAITILLMLTTIFLYLDISTTFIVIYVMFMIFITFIGPYWLIHASQYKTGISGPWDEVTLST